MEEKIKSFLTSEDETNQILGCTLAKSVLDWSNWDIMSCILNTRKNWELKEERHIYATEFLGVKIYYLLEYGLFTPNSQWSLILRRNTNRKIGIIIEKNGKVNLQDLKEYCDKFIKQNL